MTDAILSQYDEQKNLYSAFADKISSLIGEILRENGLRVHSVTYRIKERESLARKLSRPDNSYNSLADVTDIAGIRITTYLEDDVDRVAQLIEQEFDIDAENSGDKGALLDPDRFGYLSLHHVVSLLPQRCQLIEYRRFPQLKAEIQTRSILQHAWAEIEHDLGYKSTQEVPRAIRRRFSRLAGLLELADQEFIDIKNELNNYETSVPDQIKKFPQLVGIDKASLTEFVTASKLIKELDNQIAGFCNATITFNEDLMTNHVRRVRFFKIETIKELETSLKDNSKLLVAFAQDWLSEKNQRILNAGISIFYLGYILAAKFQDSKKINEYLAEVHLGKTNPASLVARVQETYDKITSPQVPG